MLCAKHRLFAALGVCRPLAAPFKHALHFALPCRRPASPTSTSTKGWWCRPRRPRRCCGTHGRWCRAAVNIAVVVVLKVPRNCNWIWQISPRHIETPVEDAVGVGAAAAAATAAVCPLPTREGAKRPLPCIAAVHRLSRHAVLGSGGGAGRRSSLEVLPLDRARKVVQQSVIVVYCGLSSIRRLARISSRFVNILCTNDPRGKAVGCSVSPPDARVAGGTRGCVDEHRPRLVAGREGGALTRDF